MLVCVCVCVSCRTAVLGISFGLAFLLLALILLLCFVGHILVGFFGFISKTRLVLVTINQVVINDKYFTFWPFFPF